MDKADQRQWHLLTRRAFVRQGTLFLAGSSFVGSEVSGFADAKPEVRIGPVTDRHYADKPPAGTRYYRESQPVTCPSGGETS